MLVDKQQIEHHHAVFFKDDHVLFTDITSLELCGFQMHSREESNLFIP